MAAAYHDEALRKTRIIERKNIAMTKQMQSFQDDRVENIPAPPQEPLCYSGPGHYSQNRSSKVLGKDTADFGEVVHDPNFKYRLLKAAGIEVAHVDPIYQIMYPGGPRK